MWILVVPPAARTSNRLQQGGGRGECLMPYLWARIEINLGFQVEASGFLPHGRRWRRTERAQNHLFVAERRIEAVKEASTPAFRLA
jgi:hypothetical protein